jgi:hypothetical protein
VNIFSGPCGAEIELISTVTLWLRTAVHDFNRAQSAAKLAELIKTQGSYTDIFRHAWRAFEADYAHWDEQRKTRVR